MAKQTATETKTHRLPDADDEKDLGPNSAGQSGDTQGLSGNAESTSESAAELAEEGNYIDAAFVTGMERAAEDNPDTLRPRKRSEDDVAPEYLERDDLL